MEVERLQAEYDIEVRFAPYLLDPTTPPEGKPRQRQTSPDSPPTDMELRGQALGITYSRGRTITWNPHLAHEAAEFAAETPFALAFQQRMFKAYFTELEDIGQLDTVVRLGVEAGLSEAGLREALESRRYRTEVDVALRWAHEVGVSGVPTFIFDERMGVVGAQDHEVFVNVMQKLGREPR